MTTFTELKNGLRLILDDNNFDMVIFPCLEIPNIPPDYFSSKFLLDTQSNRDYCYFGLKQEYIPKGAQDKTMYKVYRILYTLATSSHINQLLQLYIELAYKKYINESLNFFTVGCSYAGLAEVEASVNNIMRTLAQLCYDATDSQKMKMISKAFMNADNFVTVEKNINKLVADKLKDHIHKEIKDNVIAEMILADETLLKGYFNMPSSSYYANTNIKEKILKYQDRLSKDIRATRKFETTLITTSQKLAREIPIMFRDYIQVTMHNFRSLSDFHILISLLNIYDNLDKEMVYLENCNDFALDQTKGYTVYELDKHLKDIQNFVYSKKEQLARKNFAANQSKIANWEDDNFYLLIPKTHAECSKIGRDFHNCFGDYEWRTWLSAGKGGGGAFYRKRDNKPMYCFDFAYSDNKIKQFLKPCNTKPSSTDNNAKYLRQIATKLINDTINE